MIKRIWLSFFFLLAVVHAFAQEEARFLLDPALSYRMSKEGTFWRWGDGHLYNGELEEARSIWWRTFNSSMFLAVGMAGLHIAAYQFQFEHTNSRSGHNFLTGLSAVVAVGGGIGYIVIRNRDISSAPLHALQINARFGGASIQDYDDGKLRFTGPMQKLAPPLGMSEPRPQELQTKPEPPAPKARPVPVQNQPPQPMDKDDLLDQMQRDKMWR